VSIANTSTLNTMGVRHLSGPGRMRSFKASHKQLSGYMHLYGVRGLRGMRGLGNGVDPDTISTLTAAGYDPSVLNTLVAQGATDQQLQNLPYGPGTTADDMGSGVYQLSASLGGPSGSAGVPASQMQISASGLVYGAAVGATGPLGTLIEGSQPGTVSQAVGFATGPGGTYLTPGPNVPSGSGGVTPSAPSLASTTISSLPSLSSLFGLGSPAPPSGQPQTLLAWIEANAVWIVIIAAGAIILPPLIKKL
jgi:hypothetical protein